jgi:HEAT repeat protein
MATAASRLAALLAAALALAACSSSKEKGKDGAEDKPAGTNGNRNAPLPEKGKGAYYARIKTTSDAWLTAWAESDYAEASALESAIAREVFKHFDQVLEDLKGSDNPRWRSSAARGLGFVSDSRVRKALEGALMDSSNEVLAATLVSLGRIASADTDERQIVKLLTYPDKDVQGNAALCLSRIFQSRRQQSVPPITPLSRSLQVEEQLVALLFDKDDPIVRGNAAGALGELGSPNAEEALLNRLRDDHGFVRLKTAHAIANVGTARSRDALLDALGREEEKNVQLVLALALGAISEREGGSPPYADLKTDAGAWRKWLKK